jgi:hypothetical protein
MIDPELLPCQSCGQTPHISGFYEENKKVAFCTLRILHCCEKSPDWTDLTVKVFKSKQYIKEELCGRLAARWNALCAAHSSV